MLVKNDKEIKMISVVLTSYNGEKYIYEQIESILNQTYSDFELIIIDDKSTDLTIPIIKEFKQKDKRISLFANDENLGPRASFYKGIYKAAGNYIALSDQDDIWVAQKLEKLVKAIKEQKNALLVYSNSQNINESGEKLNTFISDIINPYSGDDNRTVLFYNFVWGHTMFFNRKLVEKLAPIPKAFNHDKWIPFLALTYGSVFYLDEVLQYYRHHAHNLTVKNKNKKKLSNDPKIKEGSSIEWIRHIANTPIPKNQIFFKNIIINYDKGLFLKIKLFMYLKSNMGIVLFPSKKNYLKKLNFLRKFLSN